MRRLYEVAPGDRFPLGATRTASGINFSIFSPHARAAWLLLYESAEATEPLQTIQLDLRLNMDHFYWHVLVLGAEPGLYYSWRMDGTVLEADGIRFDAQRELLDPRAREVSDLQWNRALAARGSQAALRARVVDDAEYDWEGDSLIERPITEEIIYELHVRGFTRHDSAGVASPGTFKGIVEKIPYLKELGITAVELLPIMAFDAQDVPSSVAARGLGNYWGYSTYGFFALHPHYASGSDARTEFRDMVKALHREGIAVILDVAFNHTAEGGDSGPLIHFKGICNDIFYHLDPKDRRRYVDYTGCGNTVNCNHPVVSQFIVECLEQWVTDMHVDGFRFDLASVLTRDESGGPDHHARVVWSIEASPILRRRLLIAEPWDAVGLHQLGSFPGLSWSEWNDAYRDSMRNFLRGDGGWIGQVASRLSGSSDLYGHGGRGPGSSINFMTCHDGFTLADLVSYNHKHNAANGENNGDGHDYNVSWNSGAEGPTSDERIMNLRERRARNFMAVLLLSQGVPMFPAGDEILRSQRGNNNAYCQDNELSWLNWSLSTSGGNMLRFTRELIALRKRHRSLRRRHFISQDESVKGLLRWYGRDLNPPDWHDQRARLIRFTLAGVDAEEAPLHVMLNLSDTAAYLPLPAPPLVEPGSAGRWRRVVDTALPAPKDIVRPEQAETVYASHYGVAAMAVGFFEWH